MSKKGSDLVAEFVEDGLLIRHVRRPDGSLDVQHHFLEDSLTLQSEAEACDINFIMKRFEKTGELTHLMANDPQYGDFSSLPSYQESLEIVHKAHEQFDALSSKVRARFDNDPAKFLAFATDPQNASEMVDMGLAAARPVEPLKI